MPKRRRKEVECFEEKTCEEHENKDKVCTSEVTNGSTPVEAEDKTPSKIPEELKSFREKMQEISKLEKLAHLVEKSEEETVDLLIKIAKHLFNRKLVELEILAQILQTLYKLKGKL